MRVHKVEGKGFYARVGDFFGPLRETANKALEALDSELEAHHPLNHHYIRCGDGTVLHLFQIPSHGWNYNIIPVNGFKGEGRGPQATFTKTLELAKQHAIESFGGVDG